MAGARSDEYLAHVSVHLSYFCVGCRGVQVTHQHLAMPTCITLFVCVDVIISNREPFWRTNYCKLWPIKKIYQVLVHDYY